MNFNILHISDLHYSKQKKRSIDIISKAFFDDLSKLEKENSLKPDFVFFTGDLISKGENSKEEFDKVLNSFINPLLDRLSLTNSDIFIVPGNHEIDRTKTVEVFEKGVDNKLNSSEELMDYVNLLLNKQPEDIKLLKRKMQPYFNFNKKLHKKLSPLKSTFFYEVFKIEKRTTNIGIICLNSAWRSSQCGSDDGRLLIPDDELIDAINSIKDCDLKFALSHHPFEMLTKWNHKSIKYIMAKDIDIFFNGHMHNSDFTFIRQFLVNLYISTCSSLHCGRLKNGYSLLNLNCVKKKMVVYLRKWYENRKEFDQETEQCENGTVTCDNFKATNNNFNKIIDIISIKNKHSARSSLTALIKPFDVNTDITLSEVFVEPILSDRSSFDKDVEMANYFPLSKIIDDNKNILFISKKEYGKTTLLKHIKNTILNDEENFADKLPVYIEFSKLPKNNYKSITKVIQESLSNDLTKEEIKSYLNDGVFVFIIDDYDDFNDDFREKRKQTLFDLNRAYNKCRYFITINENVTQSIKKESLPILKTIKAESYYLCSFKTASIRKLLEKWAKINHFDVDAMLKQIIFYFKQLQIPVTPLAVTLFIGVLSKDKSKKNIKNEAYLIENYLESMLEKLKPTDSKSELDFHEKLSFLSHFALRMQQNDNYEINRNEFERIKIDYYDYFDEELPNQKVFDDFLKKGILKEENRKVSFNFKFLFNFFLAKAMQKNRSVLDTILDDPKYLKFSTAFAYKAGLDRNDKKLLETIDGRVQIKMKEFFNKHDTKKLDNLEIQSGLIEYDEDIENEIIEKNKPEIKDKLQDEQYLSYDENDQDIKDKDFDDIIELVTLNSDIIRNTREIDTNSKKKFIKNNVKSYKGLMWQTIESFKEFIRDINKDELNELIMSNLKDEEAEIDVDQVIHRVKEIVFQIIPISIIRYMSDHLGNPKFKRTIVSIIKTEKELSLRLYLSLLLLKVDLKAACVELSDIINNSKSYIFDQIVFLYIYVYCHSSNLKEEEINEVIAILRAIRSKYPKNVKKIPVYVRDTFESDIKKSLLKKDLENN